MDLKSLYKDWHFLITESIAYGKIVLIIIGCFVLYKLTNIIFGMITKHLSAKHWVFNGLLDAVKKPLRVLFILLGFAIITQDIAGQIGFAKIRFITKFEIINIIFCIAWASIRFVSAIKKHILHTNADYEDKTLALAFSQIITVIIFIIALLVILHILKINIAGLLALGGIGGVAIGFASKDLLANFFGALMIYLDKPFQVGDWICSPEKQIEGTVESIGWRQVKIMTFETRPIYVPNAVFSNIIIENPTRMTHRRMSEKICIRYQDLYLVEEILQDVRYMLSLHEKVDKNKDIILNLLNFNEFVNISLICYVTDVKSTLFYQTRQEILLQCAKIIEKYGAQIAFPSVKSI